MLSKQTRAHINPIQGKLIETMFPLSNNGLEQQQKGKNKETEYGKQIQMNAIMKIESNNNNNNINRKNNESKIDSMVKENVG